MRVYDLDTSNADNQESYSKDHIRPVESTAIFVIPRRTLIIALPCDQVEFTDPR